MTDYSQLLHDIFIGFIALFPVINPIGSAFIVSPYFSRLSQQERRKAVKRITIYAFFVCLVALLTGRWLLELFGLTIPVVQLAGGILICKIGWDFLSPAKTVEASAETSPQNQLDSINNKLFYPITFPMTTGAGTVSVLLTLSAHGSGKNWQQFLLTTSSIMIAVIGICILIYIFYVNANKFINYLGSQREKIINSIMAFLIFCVGLQIAVEGIRGLVKLMRTVS